MFCYVFLEGRSVVSSTTMSMNLSTQQTDLSISYILVENVRKGLVYSIKSLPSVTILGYHSGIVYFYIYGYNIKIIVSGKHKYRQTQI